MWFGSAGKLYEERERRETVATRVEEKHGKVGFTLKKEEVWPTNLGEPVSQ